MLIFFYSSFFGVAAPAASHGPNISQEHGSCILGAPQPLAAPSAPAAPGDSFPSRWGRICMRPAYRCHNVEENSKVGVKAKAETGTCGCPRAVCWVPAGGTGDPLVCLPTGDGYPVISPGIFHPFNPRGALAGAKLWERPCLGRICIPGPAGRAAAAPAAVALSSPCGPRERPLPSRGGPRLGRAGSEGRGLAGAPR